MSTDCRQLFKWVSKFCSSVRGVRTVFFVASRTSNYEHFPTVSENNAILKTTICFRSVWSESDWWPEESPHCLFLLRVELGQNVRFQHSHSSQLLPVCGQLPETSFAPFLKLCYMTCQPWRSRTLCGHSTNCVYVVKTFKNYQALPGPCWSKKSTLGATVYTRLERTKASVDSVVLQWSSLCYSTSGRANSPDHEILPLYIWKLFTGYYSEVPKEREYCSTGCTLTWHMVAESAATNRKEFIKKKER